jgi:hypothetical protein
MFIIKSIKCLGINLTKNVKPVTLKTLKHCWKKLEKIWINESMQYVHDLKDSIAKMSVLLKSTSNNQLNMYIHIYIYSIKSQPKSQHSFFLW